MHLRITTLVENTKGEHLALRNEHGLCFCIERDGRTALFDTGQSDALLHNAGKLGIDLSAVELVALSHGHYDHSGGVRFLAGAATGFRVLAGRGFFEPKYGARGEALDFLGNDFDQGFLEERGIGLRLFSGAAEEVLPGVHALWGFPRTHPDEVPNERFKLIRDGKVVRDLFEDELLLALDCPRGLVVLVGCSHPGIKNMLDAVQDRLRRPIWAVLGGTHLVEASERNLAATLEYLRARDIRVLGLSHCTGKAAMESLGGLHPGYFHNTAGSSLVVEG